MNIDLTKYQIKKAKAVRFFSIAAIGAVVTALLFLLTIETAASPISFLFGFVTLIFLILGFVTFSKLQKEFKAEVMPLLIKQYIPKSVYVPEQGLDLSTVYATGHIKRADRSHTEDYIAGELSGVKFVSSDVKLEERHVRHTKNGTQTYYETYFLGRIFVFDFNKSFDGELYALEGKSPHNRSKLQKVKLESVEYNRKFRTFSTNEMTAFKVLTPSMMMALIDFEKANPGRVGFSFKGNYVYISINNSKDTFSIGLSQKIDESLFLKFKNELFVIENIVSELKLNRKIFKKI
jgi:hypothetical protein